MRKWMMIAATLLLAACSGGPAVQGTTNFNDVAVDSLTAAGDLSAGGDITLGDAVLAGNGTQIELRDAEQTIALGNLDSGAALRVDAANGKLLAGGLTLNTRRPLQGKTTNFTLSGADTRALGHNLGATGAITFTLPAAAPGLDVCFYVAAAQLLYVDPATGDRVLGLTNAPGDRISASTVGHAACLAALDTTNWAAYGVSGTWTDAD